MVKGKIRKLAREGRLIDEAFNIFQRKVFTGAPESQVEAMRICFFAGAAELHALMMASLDEGVSETDDDMTFMTQWVDELEAFHLKVIAADAAKGMRN
jgi:hypothetical protein